MASAIELKPIINKIKLTNAVWSLIILHVTRIVSAASKIKKEFSGSFFSMGPSSSGSSSGISSTSSSSSSDSSYLGFSISNGCPYPWPMTIHDGIMGHVKILSLSIGKVVNSNGKKDIQQNKITNHNNDDIIKTINSATTINAAH